MKNAMAHICLASLLGITAVFHASASDLIINGRAVEDDGSIRTLTFPDHEKLESGFFGYLDRDPTSGGSKRPSAYFYIEWGASLKSVRADHPEARLNKARWWVVKRQGIQMFGVPVSQVQFGFSKKGQFCVATGTVRKERRAEASQALLALFGRPAGDSAIWSRGPVEIALKAGASIIAITHTRMQ